jgi:hypothetical protein
VYGTVRTVVWEDGGGNPASYPMCVRHDAQRHDLTLEPVRESDPGIDLPGESPGGGLDDRNS